MLGLKFTAPHSYSTSFLSAAAKLDCFAEPVIGRAFARPVGSQRRSQTIFAWLFEKCIGNLKGGQSHRVARMREPMACPPAYSSKGWARREERLARPANRHGNLHAPVSGPVLTGLIREKVLSLADTTFPIAWMALLFGIVPAGRSPPPSARGRELSALAPGSRPGLAERLRQKSRRPAGAFVVGLPLPGRHDRGAHRC